MNNCKTQSCQSKDSKIIIAKQEQIRQLNKNYAITIYIYNYLLAFARAEISDEISSRSSDLFQNRVEYCYNVT